MSVDLEVKISVPLSTERLLLDCSQIFSGLLNITSHFEFAFLDDNSSYLGPKLLNHSVYFDEIELEEHLPWIPLDKAGTYAFVTIGGNVPLFHVVAASIIIASARQSGNSIIDSATHWIKPDDRQLIDEGYEVDCFYQALRNSQSFETVDAAASAFYAKLPVNLKSEAGPILPSAGRLS